MKFLGAEIQSVGLEFQKYGYVVHSEANAIMHASRPLEGCKLYVTLFPCNDNLFQVTPYLYLRRNGAILISLMFDRFLPPIPQPVSLQKHNKSQEKASHL